MLVDSLRWLGIREIPHAISFPERNGSGKGTENGWLSHETQSYWSDALEEKTAMRPNALSECPFPTSFLFLTPGSQPPFPRSLLAVSAYDH